jgi:hypothetical protein
LIKERNVGIGVFPEGEKILIGNASTDRIVLNSVGPGQTEVSGRNDDIGSGKK